MQIQTQSIEITEYKDLSPKSFISNPEELKKAPKRHSSDTHCPQFMTQISKTVFVRKRSRMDSVDED